MEGLAFHAGGGRAAQQALDHAEGGDGDDGGDEVREHIEAQAAEVQAVGEEKRAGNVADDGKLVQAQRGGEGGGGNDADKRAGDLRAPFLRPDEHDGDDQRADEDGLEVRVKAEAGVRGELFEVGAAL